MSNKDLRTRNSRLLVLIIGLVPFLLGADNNRPSTLWNVIFVIVTFLIVGGALAYAYYSRRPYRNTHIFISHRIETSKEMAMKLYNELSTTFGDVTIFRDVDAPEFGSNFKRILGNTINKTAVVIAIIDPHWLKSQDTSGKPNIVQPDDYVHQELAMALRQNKILIPTLIHGGEMPSVDQLPDALKKMAVMKPFVIHDESFDRDIDRFKDYLKQIFEKNK